MYVFNKVDDKRIVVTGMYEISLIFSIKTQIYYYLVPILLYYIYN